MGILTDWITEWLRGLLIDGIMGNLEGLFTNLNNRVGEIAVEVGTSPATWNAGVFSLIRQLSETVVLPIAGIVLTFVMCYELIQMLIDRNNLHDIDTWLFFKWVIKTFIAVTILSNTFNIVMAVFDVAQSVVAQSAGLVQGTTDITPNMLANMQATIEGMELGPLLGLWMQSFVVHHTMTALNIFIFVVVYGRMIEIYMLTSLAPLPFATVVNRDLGHMGHNYFRCGVGRLAAFYHRLDPRHPELHHAGNGRRYDGGHRRHGDRLSAFALWSSRGGWLDHRKAGRSQLLAEMLFDRLNDFGPSWPEVPPQAAAEKGRRHFC